MNSAQRYNFDQIREEINNELLKKDMPDRLYKSIDGITRIISTIVETKGNGWASQVVNKDGNPILTKEEQQIFSEAFQPYLDSIVTYFDKNEDEDKDKDYNNDNDDNDNNETNNKDETSVQYGAAYKPDISKLSGMSPEFLKTKMEQATHSYPSSKLDPTKMIGVDDIYTKIIDRVGQINSTVNDYASKYGILKLEKEHDLEEDIRLIPQALASTISTGIAPFTGIPPNITQEVLSKIKIPFRTIVASVFLVLDVARLAISVSGLTLGRKILSFLLAILELLRGDWKKAILTLIGYYGTIPMILGQLIKVYITMFRMLSPQIQESIIFGSLDATKSFIIGLCLSIFQVTAPEEVRLPLIGILEKIAQKKAEMDGTLEDIGLSARPDYLAPTFNDLNNIQAVMSDDAFICSCEFEELLKAVNNAAVINFVLQILRIPVTKEFREYKCGKEPCKDFITTVVKNTKERTINEEKAKEPLSMEDLEMPVVVNTSDKLTAPVESSNKINEITENVTERVESPTQTEENVEKADELVEPSDKKEKNIDKVNSVEKPVELSDKKEKISKNQEEKTRKLLANGGRVLHSRTKNSSA